jgi:hypothetical protein
MVFGFFWVSGWVGKLARSLGFEFVNIGLGDGFESAVLANVGSESGQVRANFCDSHGGLPSIRKQQGVAFDAVRDEDESKELLSG